MLDAIKHITDNIFVATEYCVRRYVLYRTCKTDSAVFKAVFAMADLSKRQTVKNESRQKYIRSPSLLSTNRQNSVLLVIRGRLTTNECNLVFGYYREEWDVIVRQSHTAGVRNP